MSTPADSERQRSGHTAIDALYRISRLVNRTEDPREALELIIDEIMRVLPAGSASIELINPDRNCLEVEVCRGFGEGAPPAALKVGAGITGWVALHGKPLNVADVREDPRYLEVDPAIRSELAVPMRSESGLVIGVVNVDSTLPGAFGEQDEKVLTLLTAEAERVLSRLWLIRQLRQAAARLEVLIDIAQRIVTKQDVGEILHTITSRALEITPCGLCAIFLRGGEDTLALRACSQPMDYAETIRLRDSAIGTAFRRRKAIEIFDLPRTEEHHFRHVIQEQQLCSMLSCPIQYEGEVIGVLNIYTGQPHRFNDGEKRVFETLASLGAAALRNAEQYRRIFDSEENLRRSERLTTLGLLSAEIAHEIRNPLTVIQLLFESLTMDFPEGDPRRRDVHVIHEKLEQLESIVGRVLSFGKSQQEMHFRHNLNRLVDDTLHLVRLKLKQERVELTFDGASAPALLVDVNKGQIQQAVLNLLINATQAMPGGGRIDITTTAEPLDGQNAAVVRIRDSGGGIDPAVQDHIFDSFLTGRPDGTGLGLSIVKRILKSHGGSVTVERSGPDGTTMRLALPLARPVE